LARSLPAIERILDVIKKSYENGQYQSPTEAERDFRQLVEREENAKWRVVGDPVRNFATNAPFSEACTK
jgi:hypothetical protein